MFKRMNLGELLFLTPAYGKVAVRPKPNVMADLEELFKLH